MNAPHGPAPSSAGQAEEEERAEGKRVEERAEKPPDLRLLSMHHTSVTVWSYKFIRNRIGGTERGGWGERDLGGGQGERGGRGGDVPVRSHDLVYKK